MKKLPVQRRAEILNYLRQGVMSSPIQLAELFGVSVMTIHRDLKQLDAEGYLSKQHGGAVINQRYFLSASMEKRTTIHTKAKQVIGKFVATKLIDPNIDSIVIDSGSTTLALVEKLPDTPMTVMVNGVEYLAILAQHKQTSVYSLGGRLNSNIMAFEGSVACDMLSKCHFTKAFIGTNGIDLDAGFSTTDTANAQLTRLMAQQAKEVYVLADLSKFGQCAFASFMNFEDITGIVTEKGVSEEFRTILKQNNVQLFEVENDEC
ncbi:MULTISPECIES: DeoR/GlpR family DNA-binding transcription regulator [Pasteurellaceae]|uniref:DeoR/GlpR family DNA-binding transcription regulator n=1 Tax=Pasteurella atlantica TaxID=2827233 RepID=A0AAW8CJX6_9PAST|nr:DeoR/GlpR family DNA-binding transcription regulator [Pasteurella atlantica]MBR0574403.1 DeoR/GlpR transcriptional regulator [Pasteurella atlantica]MDP8040307.1 DeoR/GlpR family DNA-binding transcription regulator [Pasteurella atlantica]MDP8042437.1 DeoR/GlpR family DNA-binding transcription regulator [Pasteurella atlantica]MDP8044286.1 DeoR/GlpR family DNA-binding transcription regulator [Pasteurella atlantica]MDP8046625.1 DeoR/GlpR family DNA-binding transcription regulator [Pasteurella a